MRESPPKYCPSCRYDFTGLPSAHRCPECAFEYDEQTVFWRPNNPWRPLQLLAGFILPTLMGTWTTIKLVIGRSVGTHELLGTLIIFSFVVFFSLVIYRQNRRGRFIAISHLGVHGRAYYRDVFVPWSEYKDCRLDQRGVRVTCQNRSLGVLIPQVFDDEREIDSFRAAVTSARKRHSARDSSGST